MAAALALVPLDLASSSLSGAHGAARPWRWVGLGLFGAYALAAFWSRRPLPRVQLAPAILGGLFVALAFLSTAWSISPGLTAGRALALGVLLGAAWAVGWAYAQAPVQAERIVAFLGLGAAALALAGIVAALVSSDTGFLRTASPVRFRGLGENPATAPLVEAIALPLLIHLASRRRVLGWTGVALVAGSILVGQAHAATVAGVVALLIVIVAKPTSWFRRTVLAGVVVGVALGGWYAAGAIVRHAGPAPRAVPAAARTGSGTVSGGYGRRTAWPAALHLADSRPAGGFGFGTEADAFARLSPRLAPHFESREVENSYLATYLELGVAGAVLALALLLALLRAGVRSIRTGPLAAALAAAVVAGLLEATVQSFLWSPGNVASLTLWVSAALLVGLTEHGPRSRLAATGS